MITQLFMYEGAQVRTVVIDNEPWLVAKDLCEILEISNPTQALSRLEDDERSMFNIGRQGEVNVVNEYGMYSLILGSRKAEAKAFKRWITHEVLPQIRKTGSYQQHALPQNYVEALKALVSSEEEKQSLQLKIETDKPLVQFAETCMTSTKSILVREVAKLASKQGVLIGERRMFQKLRDWELFLKNRNEPTQRGMEMGLFEIKKGVYAHPDGARDFATPKVTVKGQMYIINRLLNESA